MKNCLDFGHPTFRTSMGSDPMVVDDKLKFDIQVCIIKLYFMSIFSFLVQTIFWWKHWQITKNFRRAPSSRKSFYFFLQFWNSNFKSCIIITINYTYVSFMFINWSFAGHDDNEKKFFFFYLYSMFSGNRKNFWKDSFLFSIDFLSVSKWLSGKN